MREETEEVKDSERLKESCAHMKFMYARASYAAYAAYAAVSGI